MFDKIIAWIMSILCAISAFFGGLFGLDCDKPDTVDPPTTVIVEPTTQPTTESTTEPTAGTTQAPVAFHSFDISPALIQGLIDDDTLDLVYEDFIAVSSSPQTRYYSAEGVVLLALLEALGADVDRIGSGSQLTVIATDSYGDTYWGYDVITASNTLIALAVGNNTTGFPASMSTSNTPRFLPISLCGPDNVGGTGSMVSLVGTLVITY
ncbi:MAG: hypothetical protein FWG82_02000 [Oscillospiraceae bacterium]|nr:hypothetical protein [Oscillospiraceae bacterium]